MYLRVVIELTEAIAVAIYLIDGDTEEQDFTRKKRIKIDRIYKIFKVC
jgi:hypothetical protein